MRIIEPFYEILVMDDAQSILQRIELAGRVCYKSEERITDDSAKNFVRRIIANGHHSVLEHITATVRLVCDRGITHELVRHRVGVAYSQESSRFCNYSKGKFGSELTFIRPMFWDVPTVEYQLWQYAVKEAEYAYFTLLKNGARPEEARSVLPTSVKSEIIITANMREWRHIFSLRCAKAAHPQMRQVMLPLLQEMYTRVPVLFEDIANSLLPKGKRND